MITTEIILFVFLLLIEFLPPTKSAPFSGADFVLQEIFKGGEVLSKLTERQKLFCEEYLADMNATRAYKIAYPKVKKDEVAAVNGSKLLRNTKVREYFQELRKKQTERTEVSADKVIEELKEVAFAKDVVITGKEKMRALELLAKYFGLFVEKTQTETDNTLKITLEWKNGDEENDNSEENQ